MGKYMDKWGDVWDKSGEFYVIRRSDGNIGGWFKGIGLHRI